MALEAIVSTVLEELTSAAFQRLQDEFRLVGNVKEEVEGLTKNLQAIKAVLSDAEQRQVKQANVRVWLDELKDASYDIEDVLDEWKTAMIKLKADKKKVCFFFSLLCFGIKQIVLRHGIAVNIKKINKNLDGIAKRKNDYRFHEVVEETKQVETTSLVDMSTIYGRNKEAETLVYRLLDESNTSQGPYIISIVGIGGMGKTTLAQLAYNDDRVINNFEKRMWVCVSDPFEQKRIAKAIVKEINRSAPNLETLESLLQYIKESIAGKKFFLVLDDVWTEDYQKWEPFYLCLKNNCNGSKILITTRKKIVAEVVNSNDIINIEELSKDDSYLMFERIAFHGRSRREQEDLKEVSEKIVEKCKRLPLAIKTIGSLLRFKKTKRQWQSILKSELWELDEIGNGIFPPLLLGYYDLPPMVKPCFLYCGTFRKDCYLDKELLIYLWMAQGYLGLDLENDLEGTGEEYFNILVNRSLIIQENRTDILGNIDTSNKMHDIMHDVALLLSHNECLTVEDNDFAKQNINEKIRHLMFTSRISNEIPFSSEVLNLKKLRSFIIYDDMLRNGLSLYGGYQGQGVPQEFFHQLTKLRSLILYKAGGEIPKEIEKLIHLRLLDISSCGKINKLPDTLWQLHNLQTLVCAEIKRVPEWIGKLTNLRHLTFFGVRDPMPKEIGKLICLRKLSHFTACGDNLACLKNLVHLRDDLEISVCEDVTDVREVEKAELDKKDLFELSLDFFRLRRANASENFLNAIQPPPSLEKFCLKDYQGRNALPNWIMSLSTLRELYLFLCLNWERLPPLGKLPSLESLYIRGMIKVKRVSNEFLGVERDSAPSSSSNKLVFPKLKTLRFDEMDNWEEWDYGITKKDEEDISIMPCLHTLIFIECCSLRVVPEDLFQKTSLEKLEIDESSNILHECHREWRMRRQASSSTASN